MFLATAAGLPEVEANGYRPSWLLELSHRHPKLLLLFFFGLFVWTLRPYGYSFPDVVFNDQ